MQFDETEEIFLSDRFRYPRSPIIKLNECQEKARREIIEHIENGELKFTKADCRCGSDDDLLLGTADRYGLGYGLLSARIVDWSEQIHDLIRIL